MQSVEDLIIALEQWLRSTPITVFALWVQNTPVCAFVDGHAWVEPTIQSIHILTLSMLFGSVLMIALRVFGRAFRSRTMIQTVQRFMPVVWWSLLIMAISGVGLILGDIVRNFTNPIFWGKMILIAVAALLGAWFQSSVHRNAAFWESPRGGRAAIRAAAAGATVLWCVIMVAGRLIAYAPT
jgi:uncharacterized membrane protein SirB2